MKTWCWIVAIFLCHCTSTGNQRKMTELQSIPVVLQPMFTACTPTDGAAAFAMTTSSMSLQNVELVWNMPSDHKWDMQFNSPLGDTLWGVKKREAVFSMEGSSKADLAIDERGFLTLAGHVIPLKANEFGCLLAGRWPMSWLRFLEIEKAASTEMALSGSDQVREVHLKISLARQASSTDSCAVIEWGGVLGLFKHTAKTCVKQVGSGYLVTLDGPSGFNVNWKQTNEQFGN